MYRPSNNGNENISHPMRKEYFEKLHQQMGLKSTYYSLPGVTCNDINTSFHTSFTGFLQIFTDEKVIPLTILNIWFEWVFFYARDVGGSNTRGND